VSTRRVVHGIACVPRTDRAPRVPRNRPPRFLWARLAALFLLAGLTPHNALAQDAHYWQETYGTRAQLLGGLVIGSQVDISAVFYNPGALTFGATKELAVAGNAYRYTSITYKNADGGSKDLTSSGLNAVPSLFAGALSLGSSDKNRFAYSVLSRYSANVDVQGHGLPIDTLFGVGNLPYAAGDVHLVENLSEYWAGFSYARVLTPHIGVGITPFFAVRSQDGRLESQITALNAAGAAAYEGRDVSFSYSNWRILAKLGMSVQYPRWSAGLTITTPSGRLFGSGQVVRNINGVDQGIAGNGPTPPYIANNFQQNLTANYKSGASVGFGGSFTFGDSVTPSTIHVAGEWFAPVDQNAILDPAPFTPQTGGAQVTGQVVEKLNSVFNAGGAFEHKFSGAWGAYGSFRTDQSSATSEVNNAALSRWNITHVTGGVSFGFGRNEFVLGTDIGFGSFTQPENRGNVPEGTPVLAEGSIISYKDITFIVGYRFASSF